MRRQGATSHDSLVMSVLMVLASSAMTMLEGAARKRTPDQPWNRYSATVLAITSLGEASIVP